MRNYQGLVIGIFVSLAVVGGAAWLWNAFGSALWPVVMPPVATSTPPAPPLATVRVFFGNRLNDPEGLYCDRVYPVEREVLAVPALGQAAVRELLAGPTAFETERGFFSSLNPGVALQSLAITEGVARADFSAELGRGVGGSCWVSAIRAQITETLKQFPTVTTVQISIDGRTEDILQP